MALLTIAIPTFNRAESLSALLISIEKNLNGVEDLDDLSIIILDNASKDNTSSVAVEFCRRYSQARYIKNTENVGADENVNKAYEVAQSNYVWVIGDDDQIEIGCLNRILNIMKMHDCGHIYLQCTSTSNLSHKTDCASFDTIICGPNEVANFAGVMFTFISVNIVNINLARANKNLYTDIVKFKGSMLPQLIWIFSALRNSKKNIVIRHPMVGVGISDNTGYRQFEVFSKNLSAILDHYSDKVFCIKDTVMNSAILSYFPSVLKLHIDGKKNIFDEDVWVILNLYFKQYFLYYVILLPYKYIPRVCRVQLSLLIGVITRTIKWFVFLLAFIKSKRFMN